MTLKWCKMSSEILPVGKRFVRYGQGWGAGESDITVELACIALGGKWKNKKGEDCGLGLFDHFMLARKLIWPDRYCHRWTELMYREFIANDITILMGCASSQKTSTAVEYCLLNWWAKPDRTLVIMSTVNMDKLDIGIYAELKMLWEAGKKREPDLAGFLLEHKRAITLDSSKESGKSRDFRCGMICRPTYTGGRWQGLGVLAGTKQENIFYVADELQFMQDAFALSWPHLFANGRVKIIGSGNPKHDPDDQLAIAGEPKEGWHSHPEPEQTETWDTKFMGGRCINLVGTDSPNFEAGEGEPAPYPGLISRNFAKRIEHDHGRASFEYYKLVKGVMRVQFAQARVITRQLCRDHHALEKAEWGQGDKHRIYAIDPTYGGDDRCVGIPGEFGMGLNGQMILRVMPYKVFPFNLQSNVKVEDQLGTMLEEELNLYGIKPEDCFYDSVGKGTIGAAFARKFGFKVPVAVDTGARPSKRPVRHDLFVMDMTGQKRLKRCDEHYSKFVSELWFSVRECIEAEQLRELQEDVMLEGCARIYEHVAGNRIEVEPKSDPKKKEDLKRRLGKSPDLFDALTILVEGARQRGFQITRLGTGVKSSDTDEDWIDQEAKEYEDAIKSRLLVHQ